MDRDGEAAYREIIAADVERRRELLPVSLQRLGEEAGTIAAMAGLMVETLRNGNKVLVAGNGGSAAEAQHFSAELIGRFRYDRAPLPAICLNTDTSILTALANDYSYEDVFARQVAGVGQPGDLFLAYSTSGESENLVRAAQTAHTGGMRVISLTGSTPNRLQQASDLALLAPGADTALVQELHLAVTHMLCGIVEDELATPLP